MEKKRTIQRVSNKKRGRPKVRFNFGVLIIIFALSFIGCFVMYMISANIKGDFLDESDTSVVTEVNTAADGGSVSQTANKNDVIEYPVPQSPAADALYFKECCMITDSTLIALSSKSDFMPIIGTSQLGAANCSSFELSTGTTLCDAVKSKAPKNIYIMLGSDIGTSTADDMIKGFSSLVSALKDSCPASKIYVMELPPVAADSAPVTNKLINDYNSRLLEMASGNGVYCIDTNIIFKSASSALAPEFISANGELSDKAYETLREYILTHIA